MWLRAVLCRAAAAACPALPCCCLPARLQKVQRGWDGAGGGDQQFASVPQFVSTTASGIPLFQTSGGSWTRGGRRRAAGTRGRTAAAPPAAAMETSASLLNWLTTTTTTTAAPKPRPCCESARVRPPACLPGRGARRPPLSASLPGRQLLLCLLAACSLGCCSAWGVGSLLLLPA